jgi:hypothetical protein
MISKVEIRSDVGGFLTLTPGDTISGYVLEDIQGTDPVKATLVSTSFAQQDGAQYQSSRRETRNLIFKVSLDPDWVTKTVRDLRSSLYSVFMPKSAVVIKFFMSDGLEVTIEGRVESLESDMFSEEPIVDISVMCFSPDFVDLDQILVNGSTTAGSSEMSLNYIGTVETGILFKLLVNRIISEFTIYHIPFDGSIRVMNFQADLVADDVLSISTIPGSKFATLTRLGVDSSILFGVSPESNWMELTPGSNNIRVYAEGDPVPYTIQYQNRYGGL